MGYKKGGEYPIAGILGLYEAILEQAIKDVRKGNRSAVKRWSAYYFLIGNYAWYLAECIGLEPSVWRKGLRLLSPLPHRGRKRDATSQADHVVAEGSEP